MQEVYFGRTSEASQIRDLSHKCDEHDKERHEREANTISYAHDQSLHPFDH